jgi:hypothetical protein
VSIEAIIWALKAAPDVPQQCVSVLIGLADHADAGGRGAYPSHDLLATYTRKGARQVRRDIQTLAELKLIRLGDQRKARHIRPDKRPVVWDLAVERARGVADDRGVVHDRSSKTSRPVDNPASGGLYTPPRLVDNPASGGSPTTGGTLTTGRAGPSGGSCTSYEPSLNLKPPPPRYPQQSQLWPAPVPGTGNPEEEKQKQAEDRDLAALVVEVQKARPDWTAASILDALAAPAVAERPAELVRPAMLLMATKHRDTRLPHRFGSNGPWWTGAMNARRPVAGRPAWCRECDEETRLTHEDRPRRCPRCHPSTVRPAS